jgi:hypothetical protein
LFNFAISAFGTKCFCMELDTCSDEWRRTWWQTIGIMPGLLVSSILQCKMKCHGGACLELFRAIGRIEPRLIEAHPAWNIVYKVQLLKFQFKTHLFLYDIITSTNKVFRDWESDMVVRSWKLCNSSWETVKGYIIFE